eukprot:TRINITY_DN2579_c0_g1_i3.p2 TRINITY_DN2579_c0_g1~~TRINITY_DN2579_c0_g1_i3.p2  ORF type:complete len:112 (+),score=2.93 TRINITY_DN2579_c0_g1_i3:25-336(+)
MSSDLVNYGFATLLFLGGAMGYLKSGSVASIVASSVFASLISIAQYKQEPRAVIGVSLVLAGMMGYRALNSGKMMPGGLIAVLGYACAGLPIGVRSVVGTVSR